MKITYIESTFIKDQPKLIENLKIYKEIRDYLDMQKRQKTSTGPKTHVLGI